MSFAADVWQALSSVDVSNHIEKKGNLSYLSWAWAWGVLMEYYPESEFSFREPVDRHDGTCEVWCDLTIREGEKSLTRSMWLPAMDNRNNAVKNPDTRKISDTRMRCLTKCIGICGLGHYIYAGEDLPKSDLDDARRGYTKEQRDTYIALLESEDDVGFWIFRKDVGDETYSSLNGSFEKDKMKWKAKVAALEKAGVDRVTEMAVDFASCIDADDAAGVSEFSDLHNELKRFLYEKLTPQQQDKLKALKEAA